MAEIPAAAWVMIGDGEKALFLENKGDAVYPNLEVIREVEHANPPTREQGRDGPGRLHDGPSARAGQTAGMQTPHRSATEETDWHRLEKERFAGEIAARLYKAAHRGRFQKLIIAAPPKILGELRKEFHKEVSSRIILEMPKELTNRPVDEIEKALSDA